MSENIETPTPPVPPVTISHNQQTAENPSGGAVKPEIVKPKDPAESTAPTSETTNTPQPEQSVTKP
jgi:hypothetical protein